MACHRVLDKVKIERSGSNADRHLIDFTLFEILISDLVVIQARLYKALQTFILSFYREHYDLAFVIHTTKKAVSGAYRNEGTRSNVQ